jgi:hypothetical protein
MDLAPLGLPKEKAFGWHRNSVVLPIALSETRGGMEMNYCSTKDANELCEIELDGFLAWRIYNFILFFNFSIYTPWTAELA